MLEIDWARIRENVINWIVVPVAGLAALEVVWNLLGSYGVSLSAPLWAVKLAILAFTGYQCTGGPTAVYRDRDHGPEKGTRGTVRRGGAD